MASHAVATGGGPGPGPGDGPAITFGFTWITFGLYWKVFSLVMTGPVRGPLSVRINCGFEVDGSKLESTVTTRSTRGLMSRGMSFVVLGSWPPTDAIFRVEAVVPVIDSGETGAPAS